MKRTADLEIISANGEIAARLSGLDVDLPVVCKAAVVNGEVVAIGGLAFGGGRAYIWFYTGDDAASGIGRRAIRYARYMLRVAVQLGETEVYAIRDVKFDTSERLLKLVGFEFFEHAHGEEVWIWRH